MMRPRDMCACGWDVPGGVQHPLCSVLRGHFPELNQRKQQTPNKEWSLTTKDKGCGMFQMKRDKTTKMQPGPSTGSCAREKVS